MILKQLSLVNYKNFESKSFTFSDKINCFVGNNGVGKTNVLDAIYHLSYGKSYFNPVASQNVNHSADFFMIDGAYEKNDRSEKIIVGYKKNQKKTIKRNGKLYERFSDHIGFLPLVIVSPADRDLIIEGSETRRKFIDSIISQSDKEYLNTLIKYNKTLAQRNSLLKYFAANNTFDASTLEVYNEQLTNYGTFIYSKRKMFVELFNTIFLNRHKVVSGANEKTSIIYKSQLHDTNLDNLLTQSINKDKALQYTSVGIHKDDLVFNIENHPIKRFGSQGQQKSFLIALKLAQFDFLKNESGVRPILLLDDIFDKLDENRVSQLIHLVNGNDFGQIFISDTHKERTENIIKETEKTYELFQLKQKENQGYEN
ncbi:DNA replication/repair protein RecF [Pseudofulvibacter geojedonensis]|uniref:DNA replication and repair protein RecF n=1 Tax=Pseudofulvibacter geojedonensis TaxID=1123758 RepID=A0ABW3I2K4_9FLAO